MSDEVVGIIERSLLEKYLTTQSGYMALMLLILIPFVKTMVMTDFVAVVPLENMIVTVVLVGFLALANFKDKKQEHSTAAAQLSNPKVIQRAVDSFKVLSESLKEMQMKEIRDAVKEGDIVTVKVLNIDQQGRINLSIKKAKQEQ